jgi:hypothetical protein
VARLPGITSIAPTIVGLLGLSGLALASDAPLADVLSAATVLHGSAERLLIVAADAIGLAQIHKHPDVIAPVARLAPCAVTLHAMAPSYTPVCYASMFSGVTPEVHGIRAYEKPALCVETLFDHLAAAGKRVAIVAVADSSIDRIFRQRPIAYFSEPDDEHVVEQTVRLMADDACDVLVAYQSGYDDALHGSTPWAEDAIAAMRRVVANFSRLGSALDTPAWRQYRRIIHFAPDHGAHTDAKGKGNHGTQLPDDMAVRHHFGFRRS